MTWDSVQISEISDKDYKSIYSLLSPSRRARVDAQKCIDAQKRTLAGEFLVRRIIKDKYGIENPVITVSDNGKPVLNCPLYFSISHSDSTVVCAVDTAPVGIDIEKIRPVKRELIERVCTESELSYVSGKADIETLCKDHDILKRFFEIWCIKEAYYKKLGAGVKSFKDINTLTLKKQIISIDNFVICIIETN